MARFCGKCGSAANEKATFCNKCGNRLMQKQSIRFSYDDRSAPQNPYSTQVEAGLGPSAGGRPLGAQPAVSRPGVGTTPPSPAPPTPSSPYASSPYASSPYAASTSGSSTASPVTPSSYEPSVSKGGSLSELDHPIAPQSADDLVDQARRSFRKHAAWCAALVLVPIPFSDLVVLIPVQTWMVLSVSRIFGSNDPPERVLAYIAATSGVSVFGQVTLLIVANLIPFFGKLVSAPFVYGWTYGLGEVAIRYFESQGNISGDEMKRVFKEANSQAYQSYKKDRPSVSRDDALNSLKEQLPPEEYDRLRQKFGSAG